MGIKIVPSNTWTMDQQGAKQVKVCGANDKRLIMAVFCGSLVGDFLPIQVIYQGKTTRCHPRYEFPPEWDITHSQKHWSNKTMIQYIENIIVPYIDSARQAFQDDTPAQSPVFWRKTLSTFACFLQTQLIAPNLWIYW